MIRLPINLRLSNRYSEIHLNEEWTIFCDCNLDFREGLRLLVSIRNRKEFVSKTLMAGELSVWNYNSIKRNSSEFSKIIKRSQVVKLVQLLINPDTSSTYPYIKDFCYLRGVINIVSNECDCGFPSGESQNFVQLSNDFKKLLHPENSCFSDINLICDNASIPANRAILSARSPVFAAMLKNSVKEIQEKKVYITDINTSVLQRMVIYIYTGKVSRLTIESATDLLVAAGKYKIRDLEEICCDFLKKNSTVQDVLEMLVKGLKIFAMDYLSNKLKEFSLIQNTEEWKALKIESPALAIEILEYLVNFGGKK